MEGVKNMRMNNQHGQIIVRLAMSLLFLWFGLNQVLDAASWLGWLPQWVFGLPISPTAFIVFNGTFETILGTLLLLGIGTRWSAFLLAIHLFGIVVNLGYNDVAVRDFCLALATLSVVVSGPDEWCFDKKLLERCKRWWVGRIIYVAD